MAFSASNRRPEDALLCGCIGAAGGGVTCVSAGPARDDDIDNGSY